MQLLLLDVMINVLDNNVLTPALYFSRMITLITILLSHLLKESKNQQTAICGHFINMLAFVCSCYCT